MRPDPFSSLLNSQSLRTFSTPLRRVCRHTQRACWETPPDSEQRLYCNSTCGRLSLSTHTVHPRQGHTTCGKHRCARKSSPKGFLPESLADFHPFLRTGLHQTPSGHCHAAVSSSARPLPAHRQTGSSSLPPRTIPSQPCPSVHSGSPAGMKGALRFTTRVAGQGGH